MAGKAEHLLIAGPYRRNLLSSLNTRQTGTSIARAADAVLCEKGDSSFPPLHIVWPKAVILSVSGGESDDQKRRPQSRLEGAGRQPARLWPRRNVHPGSKKQARKRGEKAEHKIKQASRCGSLLFVVIALLSPVFRAAPFAKCRRGGSSRFRLRCQSGRSRQTLFSHPSLGSSPSL
ncbi:hypothetical protein EP10_000533 [Geobacillus icigianus]|uniref:Uncharacterized protein n=1 Tax=Geobacillus icigianus TaxID=1430331 RepID=A0ABU6BCS7_9BACL|nr:hypothetical protein [Geobacillus icigianus]